MAAGAQGAVAVNNGSMVLVSCRLLRSVSHGVGGAIVNREGGSLVIRDTVRAAPGRLGALSVPQRFLMKIQFVWDFLYGRAGRVSTKNAGFRPSCRRLFGPRSSYYCKRLLVPVLPY
jgi:hypothetical protein